MALQRTTMALSSPPFQTLAPELDALAAALGVQSVLIMRSEPTQMQVEASAGAAQRIYTVGAAGNKSVAAPGTHALYCEQVVDSDQPLFVRDSRVDPQWRGNEDEVEFGLHNYLGLPLHDGDGQVYGTVCVLDNQVRDYSAEEQAAVAALRDKAQGLLQRK
jgi:GAF domain-containing protein